MKRKQIKNKIKNRQLKNKNRKIISKKRSQKEARRQSHQENPTGSRLKRFFVRRWVKQASRHNRRLEVREEWADLVYDFYHEQQDAKDFAKENRLEPGEKIKVKRGDKILEEIKIKEDGKKVSIKEILDRGEYKDQQEVELVAAAKDD